ncbi:hypothetical protein, partial [Roseiflexus castenholzii]|uniref:hypothetical protein n=1 Tax=Roseiflexus castenholzii TaxID=120962 RepID=UPI003C7ADB8E
GRSNLIIAPPAQPGAAISSRRSRAQQSHHCATGAAGRSNLITAQPGAAISSLRHRRSRAQQSHHGAAGRSNLIIAPPAQPGAAISSRRSRAQQSHHCATGAAGRSNLLTAQPVKAISSRRSRSKQSPHPLLLPRAGAGGLATESRVSPRGIMHCRLDRAANFEHHSVPSQEINHVR